jgi:hypothetical protein
MQQAVECVEAATASVSRDDYDSLVDDLVAARLLLSTILLSMQASPVK